MPLIRNGRITADEWTTLGDDEAPPAAGGFTVSLARWRADRQALLDLGRPLGLRLTTDVHPNDYAGDLEHFPLIVVTFTAGTDGRGFSIGRLLRVRYGYAGELRAAGGFIRDLFPFLVRCGFDAIEARDEKEAAAWSEALSRINVAYQSTETRTPVFARRHSHAL